MWLLIEFCLIQFITRASFASAQGNYECRFESITLKSFFTFSFHTATCSGHGASACTPANSNCFNFDSDSLTTISCSGFPTSLSTMSDCQFISNMFVLLTPYFQSICKQFAHDAARIRVRIFDKHFGFAVAVCKSTRAYIFQHNFSDLSNNHITRLDTATSSWTNLKTLTTLFVAIFTLGHII